MSKKKTPTIQKSNITTTILSSALEHPDRAPGNVTVPFDQQSFTNSANWRVFRMMAESIEGFEFLSKLKNEVTIFGSARITPRHRDYRWAKELGYLLGKNGYTVITGGGPGIMEAANWGAHKAGGVSVGLDIELSHAQRNNKYATKSMGFHYFFTRKVMLSISSQAYIFFPGGFGTLDEMTEMLTLIQTEKIPKEVPLILIDRKFWSPMLRWMKKVLLQENKYISAKDLEIIKVADSVEEAFKIIQTTTERKFG